MTQIAAALFFAAILIGALAVLHLTVREYWQDILAALKGEMPVHTTRPAGGRARIKSRARPVVRARAVPQQRAVA